MRPLFARYSDTGRVCPEGRGNFVLLRFSLFGGVRVVRPDGTEIRLGRKQRQLLSLLLLSAHSTVSSDVIVDLLWGESLPSNPTNSMQDVVKRLRQALGDSDRTLIVTRRSEYGLIVDPGTIDVEVFRRLAVAGLNLEAAEPSAARLLLSRALEGADGDLPDIPRWHRASVQVEMLDRLRTDAARAMERIEASDGQVPDPAERTFSGWSLEGEPVGLALRLVDRGELALADLVGAVARFGGVTHQLSRGYMVADFAGAAGALAAAEEVVSGLGGTGIPTAGAVSHVEAGGPVAGAEVLLDLAGRAKEGQILVSEGVVKLAATARLKTRLTPAGKALWQMGNVTPFSENLRTKESSGTRIVGRDRAIAEAAALIRRYRVVTLRGPGGIGKTRLMLALKEVFADEFEDGAVLVDLAEAERHPDPLLLIMRTLGFHLQPHQSTETTLMERLRAGSRMLILDNCEDLVEPMARLCELLVTNCPDLTILTTSRAALGVPGEVVYDVSELEPTHAAELLVALSSDPELAPVALPTDPRVTALCAMVDCVPLAIECAAGMVRALGLEGTAVSLAAVPDGALLPLLDAAQGGRGRHRSIELALDASYRYLSASDAQLFERLGCISGAFNTEEAAVAALDDETYDITAGLERLARASLIKAQESGRWRMLEPVRQFAATLLLRRGELAVQAARHAHYFADLAARTESNLRGPEEAKWFARLTDCYPNLVKALTWLVEAEEAETALIMTSSLWWYWAARGMFMDGSIAVERALAISGPVEPALRAKSLVAASYLAWWAGNPFRTESTLLEALTLLESTEGASPDAVVLKAWAHTGLAGARMWGGGDYDELRGHLEEGARLFRAAGDIAGLGMNLSTHSGIAWHSGDDRDHLHRALAALEAFESVNHMTMIAHSKRVVGLATAALGDIEEGRAWMLEGLRLSEELGDCGGLPLGLCFRGLLEIWAGDRTEAARCFRRSIDVSEEMGHVWPSVVQLAVASEEAALLSLNDDCVRLYSAAEALTAVTGIRLAPRDRRRVGRVVEAVERALGAENYASLQREGKALTSSQALTIARSVFDQRLLARSGSQRSFSAAP